MLSECDPDTEPEPPETVDEGNTKLASLRPEEAETIRLDVRCRFPVRMVKWLLLMMQSIG